MGRIDLQWTVGSDLTVGTRFFYSFSSGSPSAADATAFASQAYTGAAAGHSMWGPTTTLSGARWTDLSSANGNVGQHTQSTPGTSASTGVLPGGVCMLVNYVTNRRYRGGKPRSYLPWGMSSDLANRQQWGSTFINNATTQVQGMLGVFASITSSGINFQNHSNVSYYAGFTVVTDPVTGRARNHPTLRSTPHVDPITSWGISLQPGSQRRRN